MRAFTWILVAVLALGVIGCEQKREEELPQIDPAELQAVEPATPPPETTATVEVETPQAVTAVPAAGGDTYTMAAGDTLYRLAKRFYGDGKLWTKIHEANKDKVRDVYDIPVGTVLTIPPK